MSEYPMRPRPRRSWPEQPPQHTDGAGASSGYGQDGYTRPYEQAAPHEPAAPYGPAGAGYDRNGYGVRRRRRGRVWIALLSTLVVLAVLFVIGDQIAKGYAQNKIADRLQSSASLTTRPSVTIEGFPFLTQVAEHDVRTVDISASNVPAGKLTISSVKATATGVHLNSAFSGATIDRISGSALVTFASLVNAAGAHGVTITADPSGGPNAANVNVGPVTATAQVTQTGPNQITIKMEGLGGIAASLIGSLPDYTFTVPKLPAGLRLRGVFVTGQGIVIKVAAQDTTLSQ